LICKQQTIIVTNVNIRSITQAVSSMRKAGILNQATFDALMANAQCAYILRDELATMQNAGILNQDTFDTLIANRGGKYAGWGIRYALASLQHFGILTHATFHALIANERYANTLCNGFRILQRAGIFTPANRDALMANAQCAYILRDELATMQNAGILNQDTFDTLIANRGGKYAGGRIRYALATLQHFGILTHATFHALIANERYAITLCNGFRILQSAGIFTPANRDDLVANAEYAHDLANGFSYLQRAHMFTQENSDYLVANVQHVSAYSLATASAVLQEANILTTENRQALITAGDHMSSMSYALTELMETNAALVNQGNFNALIAAGANALMHAREIIRQAQPAVAAAVLPIHDRQSTHLASVHRSSSDSATRLMSHYGSEIEGEKLNPILRAIQEWAGALPAEQQSVKDCVTRLTAVTFIFEDPSSHVSMHQLLALAWTALHDDSACIGTVYDSLAQFAEGLKEMQNEYGLGLSACSGGSFNKIIEKLVGIHPAAEQLVITSEQATAKFPIVVKEEAYKYLYSLSNPKSVEELQAFTDLIAKIRAEGTAVIWPAIENTVADRMIDEYGSIYNNRKDDAKFKGLLEDVSYVELNELDRFQKKISESAGYDGWMRRVLLPSAREIKTYELPHELLQYCCTDATPRP
jgi:phosphoribosylformylglycinamidine (FGAM) synthase-like amidotransferase family enzyme